MRILRLATGLVAILALATALAHPALAQDPAPLKQIKLTVAHIDSFVGAQKELAAFEAKHPNLHEQKPDAKMLAEIDTIVKKHGFKNFEDFEDVAANISLVMSGIDPQTGEFTDPITAIKQDIDAVKADKTIPEKDRVLMLQELDEALKQTPPMQFPENVELVKQHRGKIEEALR